MCGIIGYIGNKPLTPILLEGLQRLEYRGYDSSGVAVVCDDIINFRRSAGRLRNLNDLITRSPIDGTYGLGHTRWATHGKPCEENTHPLQDCTGRIAVVHNGIIENHRALKHQLEKEGHRFISETDTETIAHLVEREMHDDGLENAVRRALAFVKGVFSLAIIATNDPEKIVAVQNGPPLIIGEGNEEFFVSSDVSGFLNHTKNIAILSDDEMAIVTRQGVKFTKHSGLVVSKPVHQVTWDADNVDKADFPHFTLKEIFEQPSSVRATLHGHTSNKTKVTLFEDTDFAKKNFQDLERVVIVACGSSWNASLVGKFLIEDLTRLSVEVDYGSEFRYRNPILNSKTLVVGISQSGETADTIGAIREARSKDARTIMICNTPGSTATREAEATIYTQAGPEVGVAATKTFSSQLVCLYLLALSLAQARNALSDDAAASHLEELSQLPQLIEKTLLCHETIKSVAQQIHQYSSFLYFGRGILYPIALEGALKLKEISYVHAEGYPAGEMKHGPIALIDEHVPVVALIPDDGAFEKMYSNMEEAKARGAKIIAITSTGKEDYFRSSASRQHFVIPIPRTRSFLPVLMAIPLQLLAYEIGVCRGRDVDHPRNLAKSVTVE